MNNIKELEKSISDIDFAISELRKRQAELRHEFEQEKSMAKYEALTPLVEAVFGLNPKLRYAAMDRNGRVLFYTQAPQYSDGAWRGTPAILAQTSSRYQVTALPPPNDGEQARIFFWENFPREIL